LYFGNYTRIQIKYCKHKQRKNVFVYLCSQKIWWTKIDDIIWTQKYNWCILHLSKNYTIIKHLKSLFFLTNYWTFISFSVTTALLFILVLWRWHVHAQWSWIILWMCSSRKTRKDTLTPRPRTTKQLAISTKVSCLARASGCWFSIRHWSTLG